MVSDEGGDGRLHLLDAAVNTAADLALGQEAPNQRLDLIEPGGVQVGVK